MGRVPRHRTAKQKELRLSKHQKSDIGQQNFGAPSALAFGTGVWLSEHEAAIALGRMRGTYDWSGRALKDSVALTHAGCHCTLQHVCL